MSASTYVFKQSNYFRVEAETPRVEFFTEESAFRFHAKAEQEGEQLVASIEGILNKALPDLLLKHLVEIEVFETEENLQEDKSFIHTVNIDPADKVMDVKVKLRIKSTSALNQEMLNAFSEEVVKKCSGNI
ncbi:MAG: hypothetical protein EBR30_20410 [Cytophagia bacterium]|nr:hypothetical protein [Cytophagia bacterium]